VKKVKTVNKNMLQGKIKMAGLTQRELAIRIGMSENTLCSRLNGHSFFNTNEIDQICNALSITSNEEKIFIFLATTSQERDARCESSDEKTA